VSAGQQKPLHERLEQCPARAVSGEASSARTAAPHPFSTAAKEPSDLSSASASACSSGGRVAPAKSPLVSATITPEATVGQVVAFLTLGPISIFSDAELSNVKAAMAAFTQRVAKLEQLAQLRAVAPEQLWARVHPSSSWSCRKISWSCRGCGGDHHSMLVADCSMSRFSDGGAVACQVVGRFGCTDMIPGPSARLEGEQFLRGWVSIATGKTDFDHARAQAVDRTLDLDLIAMNMATVRRLLDTPPAVTDEDLRALFHMLTDTMQNVITGHSETMEDTFDSGAFIQGPGAVPAAPGPMPPQRKKRAAPY